MADVNWGKVVGGVALTTGAAIMGVGLGGEALAGAIGPDTAVGGALSTAAETVNTTGAELAGKVGLEAVSGKTAAAVAGGTLAAAGVTTVLASGHKDDDHESPEDKARREQRELADIRRRMKMAQEEGMSTGLPPTTPKGRGIE